MRKRLILALLASTGLAGMGLAGPALAQDASPPPGGSQVAGNIETIYVTARKRSEDEQTVPISLDAYSQADLDQLNIRTIEDLRYVSPSVYIAPTTFRQDTLNVTIRGQRDFDSSSGQSVMSFDTAAAIYMDGVYMARPVGLSGSLFDIDNVEVLKGPQGTLVGRNSTGGAILYTTREPTDQYGGYLKMIAGDYGRAAVEGAVNIPLTDQLFFRAAMQVSDQRGYISNHYFDPATGYRNNQPAMGSNKVAGNFSLKWQPDSTFNIVLRANISAEHDTGSSYHDLGYFPGSGTRNNKPAICNIPGTCTGFTDLLGHVIAPYYTNYLTGTALNPDPKSYNALLNSVAREQTYGFWSTEQTVSNADIGHYQTVSATVNKTLGDIDVKWLTAMRWWDNRGTSVGRGLPYDTADYEYMVPDYKSYQSELTVNGSALDDKLKWTTGLFFFQEDSPRDGGLFYLYLPSAVTPQAVTGKQITLQDGTHNSQRNTSYAAYAQATYSITSDTRLTAGFRYTYDERHALLDLLDDIFPATNTPNGGTNASVVNGVFDPTPVTFNGITYAGQTHACALTDTAGKLKPLASCATNIDVNFHKPTYTIALDHDLWDGTMIYATTRSGYRSGAINSAAVQPAAVVARPENVTDYEVGIKSDWDIWNMPIRANLAGYFSDYHDIQTLVSLPNITIATTTSGGACNQAAYNANTCLNVTNDNVTLNAHTAHIHGVEWDVTIIPVPQLTLSASGSYLDARYTNFTYTPPPGYLLPNGTTNLSGSPFPLPAWQTNETATWSTGLDNLAGLPVGDLALTAHYYWQSRYLANMTGFDPSQRAGAYGMLNMRATLVNVAGKNVDATVFMNNVANTQACMPEYQGVLNSAPNASFGIANTSGVLQCVPLPPRMTGIELDYKF